MPAAEPSQVPADTRSRLRGAREVAVETARAFGADGAASWAAALAFYTMLSVGPLLCVTVAACGLLFGHDAALEAVVAQVQGLMGETVGSTLRGMVEQAAVARRGILTTLAGTVTLIFGASGVFSALQEAIDAIWHVQPDPRAGIGTLLRRRFLSLAMVGCMGFVLATSQIISAAIAAAQEILSRAVPMGGVAAMAVDLVAAFCLFTAFFAAIYRVLPDARIGWRYTLLGGAATALLFDAGKLLIGLYVRHAEVSTPYGAAGSHALMLIWTYYAAQVFLLGATLTRVCVQRFGGPIQPAPDAVRVEKVVRP